MKRSKLLHILAQLAQIIIDNCETDEEIEQIKIGIEEYLELLKSCPQT